MQVFLEAIKFNHDPDSANCDAFNIRKNEKDFVTVPEWQRGVSFNPEDSPAAYAICETRGRQITIQAKFKCTGTDNRVRVRAVYARACRNNLGCSPIGSLLRVFSWARGVPVGNVLGQVKEREIVFNAGETGFETFELQNVQLWSAGVSASTTAWRWQFRTKPGDQWTDFALSRHRIYTLLEVPNCPWEQMPFNKANTQLPWAGALEYACDWAASAQEPDEAAILITQCVNDLGLGRVTYSGSPLYSCPNFNCTQFLNLLGGGTGMGRTLNCSDCATIVSSFANLVGCNLRQLTLGPSQFLTNPIRILGRTHERPFLFFGHEVAWKGSVSEESQLFDACLQVDGDDLPHSPPFASLRPANIRFGKATEKHYRFRLSPRLTPLADTLSCRKIGNSVAGDCRRLDNTLMEFLKVQYDYMAWSDLAPEKQLFSSPEILFSQPQIFAENDALSDWTPKLPVEQPKLAGVVQAFQSLWHLSSDKDTLVRFDLFECKTWQDARQFMLLELGEFHLLQVERLTNPKIGDVSFVEAGEVSVLFSRSQFVVLLRSAGLKPIPVRQTAMDIDRLLVEGTSGVLRDGNTSET